MRRARPPDAAVPAPSPAAEPGQAWRSNFAVILAIQFVIFMTFSSVFPFMPLFLRELGEDEAGAVAWTGVIQATAAVVLIFANPLWGTLADRVGQKPMVLRALVGVSVSIALMALSTQAWHLVVLRALQGATSGTNTAVIALAGATLPIARLSMGMGLLQTAQFLGSSLGPLFGSLASAQFGFRGGFLAASGVLVAVAVAAALFVREPPRRAATAETTMGLGKRLGVVWRAPQLRAPIVMTGAFQTAYMTSMTLLPLHVAGLAPASDTTWVGIVLTSNALGVALGAVALGWLGGRWGETRLALGSMGVMVAFSLLQTWVASPVQLAALRLCIGLSAGGILPLLRASLGLEAQRHAALRASVGAVYGVAQSAYSVGMVIGPLVSSPIATAWGIPATHAVSAGILAFASLWYAWASRSAGRRQDRP